MKSFVAAVCGIGVGIAMGIGFAHLARDSRPRAAEPTLTREDARLESIERELARVGTSSCVCTPCGPTTNIDSAELTTTIRAAVRDALDPPVSSADAAPPAPEPTAAAIAAFGRASTIVADARRAGVWRMDDARTLEEFLPTLTQEQRAQATQQVMTALNDGSLRMGFRGAPL